MRNFKWEGKTRWFYDLPFNVGGNVVERFCKYFMTRVSSVICFSWWEVGNSITKQLQNVKDYQVKYFHCGLWGKTGFYQENKAVNIKVIISWSLYINKTEFTSMLCGLKLKASMLTMTLLTCKMFRRHYFNHLSLAYQQLLIGTKHNIKMRLMGKSLVL